MEWGSHIESVDMGHLWVLAFQFIQLKKSPGRHSPAVCVSVASLPSFPIPICKKWQKYDIRITL